jgi:Na+-transporting NADH:ubiquinone oxidoreductase subunit A
MNIALKKGLNLKIAGEVSDFTPKKIEVKSCAIVPDDFVGLTPKPEVKEGDKVAIGSPILFDKGQPLVKLVSPLSGRVKAIVRGERRKILRVVIEADGSNDYVKFDTSNLSSAENVINLLGNSGLLATFRRRPYDTVPRIAVKPRDIFVTAFDSAPLAVSLTKFLPADAQKKLEAAVAVLRTICAGNVYVSSSANEPLAEIKGAVNVTVSGPHPAGNVGPQISAIAPVNKGETVWTLDIVTLYKIGHVITTGQIDPTSFVAICGPEVKSCGVVETVVGAEVAPLIAGRLQQSAHTQRVISGNVLTGTALDKDDYLRMPYRQISVISEGDDVDEFMGWASLSPKKMSVSRSFPGHFFLRKFIPDARILGGRRAMIMSGEYDKVIPMGIMAEYLLKAIISRDIDEMEQLGIYEVAPEDFALAEYVDTSKMPIQQIVRDGLDYLRKELE